MSLPACKIEEYKPREEAKRLAVLRALNILDTPSEPFFDTITRLAAAGFRSEAASLTFVDETRAWSKSTKGGRLKESSQHDSIAKRIVIDDCSVVILDLDKEAESHDSYRPLRAFDMRFFAGVPLRVAGQVVGALCVRGVYPRDQVLPRDMSLLEDLADLVTDRLEMTLPCSFDIDGENLSEFGTASSRLKSLSPIRPEWPSADDLREALKLNQFVLHYQPEVNLHTGQIIGFEALVRWQHPKRGLIEPGSFIPQAEESGVILPIGDWGLSQACHQLQQWRQRWRQLENLQVCVNLSARQFSRNGLVDHVESLLDETGLSGRHLGLEMTESSLIPNMNEAAGVLDNLHQLGVSLHMDDFGTGYSSLSHLHHFPFDLLKIDRSFVQRLQHGEQPLQITRTILELARVLKMDVVAEGIETEEQMQLLKKMGCRFGQGYFFSKPLPVSQIEEMLCNGVPSFPAGTVPQLA